MSNHVPRLSVDDRAEAVRLVRTNQPFLVVGATDSWVLAGPASEERSTTPAVLRAVAALFEPNLQVPVVECSASSSYDGSGPRGHRTAPLGELLEYLAGTSPLSPLQSSSSPTRYLKDWHIARAPRRDATAPTTLLSAPQLTLPLLSICSF